MSKEKVHRKRILSPRTIKFIAFAIAVIIQLAVLLVPYLFFRDYLTSRIAFRGMEGRNSRTRQRRSKSRGWERNENLG